MGSSNIPHAENEADEVPALPASPACLQPDEDIMMFSDDEHNPRVYTPPARLAARFYPPKTNRKRSSAASSRRNSLSSSHSHISNKSFRTVQRTNYVAQQLRRASILETRKARLQDRAAHAEQVRLRAALVKAAPKQSNTEERAIAAQQAREKMLAKVAAACAEEVARAKKVAEEMKEKKAEEERRARMQIEEKHAEAERRRMEYTKVQPRKPRSRSVAADGKPASESKRATLDAGKAAERIQKAWRHRRRKLCVKSFMQLNLNVERVKGIEFMEATELLADEKVINLTRHMMDHTKLDAGDINDQTQVRRFLSAYMILGQATDVFNKHGQQEEDLMSKAKELLISFEGVLGLMSSSELCVAPATEMETLSQAYASYCTSFDAWKTQDKTVLTDTMIAQFVAFDSIWQTVKDDTRGMVAADYRDAIRDQQILLLSKIKKLAGAENANRRIKQAIRESRRARRQQRPVHELRPRPISTDSATYQQSQDVPSPTAAEEIQAETSEMSIPSQDELSRVFSIIPPNRDLVHELMIDPEFRIEVSPQSDTRNALNREVCLGMRRAIDAGQGDIWTVAVAENIRKRLLKLLKPGNHMHTLLSEYLDPERIHERCDKGQFSYEEFFDFMADLLPRLCAPFRDDEVKALGEVLKRKGDGIDAMVEKLFGLLHVIDAMSLDYTNYMLQQAAPTLIQEGQGYEARAFEQDLAEGNINLQKTKRWWRNATIMTVTESSVHETPASPSNAATTPRVYARGLTELAFGSGTINEADVPETLSMDLARLSRIRKESLGFAAVGAILLTAKNLLRRDIRSQWKPEAKRVFDSLKDSNETNDEDLAARIVGIISSGHGMPQSSASHLTSFTARMLASLRTGRATDPVFKLLIQRLKTHMFNRLAASSSAERVRVVSTASEGLAGIGLAEFVGQIGTLGEELSRVAKVDKDAHVGVYQRVMREMESEGVRGVDAMGA